MTEKVYTIKDAARLLRISENALRMHLHRGTGPPARRMGKRKIIVLESELFDWIARMEFVSRPRLRGVGSDGKVIDPELTIELDEDTE